MSIESKVQSRLRMREVGFDPRDKLLNRQEAQAFVQKAHDKGKSVILVQGTFDLTHAGHVEYIRHARKHADLVLLRLASAEYAHNIKGPSRPIEIYRDIVVSEFEGVDAVFVDDTGVIPPHQTTENALVLRSINPDMIALNIKDSTFKEKLMTVQYANQVLGSHITPVIVSPPSLTTTTQIIHKIKYGTLSK